MSDLKILNLEALHPNAKRELVVDGKSYNVKFMTVEAFVRLTMARKAFAELLQEGDIAGGIDKMIEIVSSEVEGLPADVVKQFNLQQLQAVIAFLFDELPDEYLEGSKKKEKTKKEQKAEADKEGN